MLDLKHLDQQTDAMQLSYIRLRQLIGALGMGLPVICIFGGIIFAGLSPRSSISTYYYTNMGDVFVGIMVGVSMFLITYKGYLQYDQFVTTLTGVMGFGVAIFPTTMEGGSVKEIVGMFQLEAGLSNVFHSGSAILFFGLLAVNSIFLFTKTDNPEQMTEQKKKRNLIYRVSGGIIVGSIILLIIAVMSFPKSWMDDGYTIIILESIMLEAFGIAWLVKGEAILKDKDINK